MQDPENQIWEGGQSLARGLEAKLYRALTREARIPLQGACGLARRSRCVAGQGAGGRWR
jgi:hypothetical protein